MGRGNWGFVRPGLVLALLLACGSRPASALNSANQFCSGDPCVITSAKDVDAGAVLDFGTRAVVLQNIMTLLPLPSGDIGSVTILAGSFSIIGSGQIKGSSTDFNGGSITITVVNDIHLDSTVSLGGIRLSGLDGGNLTLTTTVGSVSGSGKINIYGDGLDGSAGTLTVNSAANITFSGQIDLHGSSQGEGGEFDLTSGGDITISGFVDLSGGGDGGDIDVTAGGSFTLGDADMSGNNLDADAGLALIDAGGNVNFVGAFRGRGADQGADCGDGADVDISAYGDITVSGAMDIRGQGLDCTGGCLSLDGASVYMTNDVRMSGTGTSGSGGELDVTATTLARLSGTVELDGGDGGGGIVYIDSNQDAQILGTLTINGRAATSPGAELVEIDAGKLTVGGTIDASAGSSAVPGGPIVLAACDVITQPSATIKTLGQGGSINVRGSDTIQLRGRLTADPTAGIKVRASTKANPPDVAGAIFSPAPTYILDTTIVPCRVCDKNADCADGNPCTDDICNNFTACLNPPHVGSCDDGNLCTSGDSCVGTICVGGPPTSCDDGNPCTADSCTPALGCQHATVAGPCDDGNPCTTGDSCATGRCVGTPINCNDGNACTDDACSNGVCQHAFNTAPCSSDGNPCTDDVCGGGACTHPFNTAPCNDGNQCTSGDRCSGGVCTGGPQISCDDHDLCTTDSCNPASGCQHAPVLGCFDGDHDGKQDNVDECTALSWTASPTKPPNEYPLAFGLSLGQLADLPGTQSVFLSGLFNIAGPELLPIDPSTNGLHIHIEDAGGVLYDVSLPGGAAGCASTDGWATAGAGIHRTWVYHNRTNALPPICVANSAHGIELVQIRDYRLARKAGLQFKIKAKNAALLRQPALPFTYVEATVALAAQPSPGVASAQAKAGECADAHFSGNPISNSTKPYCKMKLQGMALNRVTCKGR